MHHCRRRFVSMHALAVFAVAAAAWVTPPSRASEPVDAAQTVDDVLRQAAEQKHKAELNELLWSGLNEHERRRTTEARAELTIALDTIARIDREITEKFASVRPVDLRDGPPYLDVTLLGAPFSREARPTPWTMAHEAVRRYDAEGAIARLHTLSTAPRFPIGEQAPENLASALDFLSDVRNATQVLVASARRHAYGGDARCAVDDIRASLRLGAMLSRTHSFTIEILVGISITASGVSVARELMQIGLLDAEDLEQLGAAFDEALRIPDRSASIEVDAIEMRMFMSDIIYAAPPGLRRMWQEHARAVSESVRAEQLRLAGLTPSNRAAAAQEFQNFLNSHNRPFSPINAVLEIVKPSGVPRLVDQVHAESHGVRLAIAVEAYRLKHGELPASLDVLVPEFIPALPVDPYAPDGRFRYQFHPVDPERRAGFVIYSVGLDGVDDGGTFSDNFWGSRYDATSGQCTKCDLLIYPVTE
jgi:hypothetical protein